MTRNAKESVESQSGRKAHAPVGKNESIAVEPLGVLGVGVEEPGGAECVKCAQTQTMGKALRYLENKTWAAGAIPMGAPMQISQSFVAQRGQEEGTDQGVRS